MKPQTRSRDLESALVQRARAGDIEAFSRLAETHRASMRSLALRMTRNSDDANDAIQDALLKSFRAIERFQPGKPFQPWLLRIVSNCCIDLIRHRKGVPESLDNHAHELQDGSIDASETAESKAFGELIRGAVDRLPERYRAIVMMRHFRDMEVNEIAHELNKPEGTIKSWLFRARALLRKDLQVAMG